MAERRVRRLTYVLIGFMFAASALGGWLYFKAEHQKLLAAEAQGRADRAALELERERRARLESTLGILVPMGGKTRYMLMEAARAADRDLDRWIHLLGLTRQVVLRTAETAPTDVTRQQATAMAGELQQRIDELKQRLERNGTKDRTGEQH